MARNVAQRTELDGRVRRLTLERISSTVRRGIVSLRPRPFRREDVDTCVMESMLTYIFCKCKLFLSTRDASIPRP